MLNLWAIIRAVPRSRLPPTQAITRSFRVMPWDVGIRTLKSDRYFTIAECAQLDFVTRTGLLAPLLVQRIVWFNLGQASSLRKPLRLFQSFVVSTKVTCVDDKHAYFSHTFYSTEGGHAEVLVKAKFKKGSITVAPSVILGAQPSEKSLAIRALDDLLVATAEADRG